MAETLKLSIHTLRNLYLLLTGIQRHIKNLNPSKDASILEFKPLKNVSDFCVQANSICAETKVTKVIALKEEDALRESGEKNYRNSLCSIFSKTVKSFA